MRTIVEQLMVPTYINNGDKEWYDLFGILGTADKEAVLFDARKRPYGATVKARTDTISMSIDEQAQIMNDLRAEGIPITEENMRLRWYQYMTGIGQVGQMLDAVEVPSLVEGDVSTDEDNDTDMQTKNTILVSPFMPR